jgi:hypothetical protein
MSFVSSVTFYHSCWQQVDTPQELLDDAVENAVLLVSAVLEIEMVTCRPAVKNYLLSRFYIL